MQELQNAEENPPKKHINATAHITNNYYKSPKPNTK